MDNDSWAALAQHNHERKIIMLYFIKGDSQENWGAMKLTLSKGANVSRVIWQTSQDGWTCVGAKEFNAWQKKFSKPKSRPTQLAPAAGDSAVSTSSLKASALSTSQAESAPTQRG